MRLAGRSALALLSFGALAIAAGVACSAFDAAPVVAGDAGSDATGDPDAVAPSLGCPAKCLPPAPRNWLGPSAVFDAVPSGGDPPCPAAYPDVELVGGRDLDAGPATCDCNAGKVVGAACRVGYVIGQLDCTVVETSNVTVPPPDGGSVCMSTGGTQSWFVNPPTLTDAGACAFPSAVRDVPDASFARRAVSCGRPTDPPCEGRPDCRAVEDPGAPFNRVCIHQTGDVPCPSADYAARFVAYTGVDDKRGCTACNGAGAAGCGSTFAVTNSCASPLGSGSASADGTCEHGSPFFVLDALGPVPKACSAAAPSHPTGAATESGAVTFCCNR